MSKNSSGMKIGILTAGGDCPGLNAAIRGVGKTAIIKYGMKIVGISDGFSGMINKEYVDLSERDLSGILTLGGTILGTSREKPFKSSGKKKSEIKKSDLIVEHYGQLGLDCLVCIGGNGTLKTAHLLAEEGTPSPMDRVLATRYGTSAADMIASRDFGKMVALKNDEIVSVPLADVAGKLKLIKPDDPRVIQAQNLGTSFGV